MLRRRLRTLRRALGLPLLAWRVYLAAAAVFLALSYLSATVFPRFFQRLSSYNPSYYEPKDFQRGDHLTEKASEGWQGKKREQNTRW